MNTTDNESKINSFFESNESESVGDRFVNALMVVLIFPLRKSFLQASW